MASKFLGLADTVEAKPRAAQTALTTVIAIDLADLDKICTALEKAFPRATFNEVAVKNAGMNAAGEKVVRYAISQRGPNGQAVIYFSGKLVLSGAMAGFTL